MTTIHDEEVDYVSLSVVDDVGKVFRWREGVYRGIYPAAADHVRKLFESGFLLELIERGLFPKSEITEYSLTGFAYVVRHEAVPVVTYPFEWSFDMLRAAALAVLEVNDIAGRFGWGMKDCHPYNILFRGAQPLYIDLGSFVPAGSGSGFGPGSEFLSFYWFPLSIWATGDAFLPRRIVSSVNGHMPEMSWTLYRNPFMRWLGEPTRARIARLGKRVERRVSRIFHPDSNPSFHIRCLTALLPAEFVAQNTKLLRQKIESLSLPSGRSAWESYHCKYFTKEGLVTTPRFERLVDIVRQLNCESVVELGGNRGLFSLLLLEKTSIRQAVCTDDDSNAINHLYRHVATQPADKENELVQPVVLNFMIPEHNIATRLPTDRFRSDLATALAITHHLTLGQNFPLPRVIRRIAAYTRKYAMVEFMPRGLWDGQSAPPVPFWYCEDWFREGFSEVFDVITVEQLEPNRTLYVGRLKEAKRRS